MTRDERNLLADIDRRLSTYMERTTALLDTHERIKVDVTQLKRTVYENGLNSQVRELHDWMLEQKRTAAELRKQNDEQEHEASMQKYKLSAETRQMIIQGAISITAVLATALLAK